MRNFFVKIKNNNSFFYYVWSLIQQKKGVKSLKNISDYDAINFLYRNYSGKIPNIEKPTLFSEKLQWLKLYYRDPLQTICADKFLVRDYLIQRGYKELLNNVILVTDSVFDIDLQKLPKEFVIKATHGSGWNLICTDKRKVNWFWWKKTMDIWLNNNLYWPGREWPYKNMKPRLIVEEYLVDNSGKLMDYKFFCFNGVANFIQANKGRDTSNHAQNFYDLEWNILPFGKDLIPRPDIKIEAPKSLQKMIEISNNLSKDFPFVRIDFYEVNECIVFGEMTFYPKSGLPDFVPKEYDLIIGRMLKLPEPFN